MTAWLGALWVGAAVAGSVQDDNEARGLRAVEPRPPAPSGEVIVRAGEVLTATEATYAPGFVHIRDGRIVEVGPGDGPEVPGARVWSVPNGVVTPGLIDTHSHLGVYPSPGAAAHGDGNEATAPSTAGVWAEHSVWPQDPGFQRAAEGGVTTLQVLPGSANLIGGRGVTLHVAPGARGSRAMRLEGAPETVKMACGENPKRVYGDKGGPSTRMGNLRGQREAFLAAIAYRAKWDEYEAKLPSGEPRKGKQDPATPPPPPERDLDQETLVGVLEGHILPQIHCYRADDMLSMLQLADEFGFRVRSFHHAVESYKIRDILAEREVSVSTWADWWGFKLEAFDAVEENLAMLTAAGARGVLHSDSAIGIQRLNQEAGKALAAGRRAGIDVDETDALRWITANPAWALGVDAMVGTLEPGKRGDVVVWSGDPLSVYARAELVLVDGVVVVDRSVDAPPWSDFQVGREVSP